MRMSADTPGAEVYRIVDAETGEEIPNVMYADEATGMYVQAVTDGDGYFVQGGLGYLKSETKWGRIRFERI